MFCGECGTSLTSVEKYCSKCGTETQLNKQSVNNDEPKEVSTSNSPRAQTHEMSKQAKLASVSIVILIAVLFFAYIKSKSDAENRAIVDAIDLRYQQNNIAAGRAPNDPGTLPLPETAQPSVASNPIFTNEGVQYTQCDEPVRISDCSFQNNITPYCTFENTSNVVLTGRVFSWQYDQSGVLLNKSPSISLDGLQPGHKKREWLGHGSNHGAVKYVICSVDPESEFATGITR